MFKAILSTFRWLVSLGAKFMRVTPGATSTVVLATLISQVSVLLAFFLPLKVLILLGSDGMPRYFPAAFEAIDRDVLVVILSIATVVFYVLHLLSEKVIKVGTERGTSRLLLRSQKMILFENQNEAAERGYQRYSYALAAGVFVVLALAVLAIIYQHLFWLLLGFITGGVVLFWTGFTFSPRFREVLNARLAGYLNVVGAIGFLLVFAYLVIDFIFWSPPGLLLAIISLLLSRQVFTRTVGMVSAIVGLTDQQTRLDALFFHGKVLLPEAGGSRQGIWPLLEPGRRDQWMRSVLKELIDEVPNPLECCWWQLGEPNVVAFHVCNSNGGWLIKLFDIKRSGLALHETIILSQPQQGLPAPKLAGATQVKQFHCHVLSLPRGGPIDSGDVKQASQCFRQRCLSVDLSPGMVKRYLRSRPLFWHGLDEQFMDRLRLAADDKTLPWLERLARQMDVLRSQLDNLPLWVVNPKISPDTLFQVDDGAVLSVHWGRWRLEPIGAGWPVKQLGDLARCVTAAAEHRPVLSEISSNSIELAALTYEMHKAYLKQRYMTALELLPDVMQRLTDAEEA